jgi:hypothetical protein
LLAYLLYRAELPWLAGLVPPGSVYQPAGADAAWTWLPGPLLAGLVALVIARVSLARCEHDLRRWYDKHHGARVME